VLPDDIKRKAKKLQKEKMKNQKGEEGEN